MAMDYHAYWDQRNAANAEKRYQLGLERAATGEGQLASMVGSEKAKDAFSSGVTGLARGGLAKGRRPYLVGEKGPELMVPDRDGTVIPNDKLRTLVKAAKKPVPRARGGRVQAGGAGAALEEDRAFGFRNTGGIKAAAGNADLALAGAELGAPTSYAGGAGAPTPIGVIRGTKQTYATDAGGPQLSEFATPSQAGQAYNRRQLSQDLALAQRTPGVTPNVPALKEKHGEYVPVGGELEKIKGGYMVEAHAAYNKRPDLVQASEEAAKEKAANAALGVVRGHLAEVYGTNVDGKRVFKPKDEGMQVDAMAAEQHARVSGSGEEGKRIFGERQGVRDYLSKMPNIPKGFDANAYISAAAQNPAVWAKLVKEGTKPKVTVPPPAANSDPLYVPNLIKAGARAGGRTMQGALSAGAGPGQFIQ